MSITGISTQVPKILEWHPQVRIHSAFTSGVYLRAGDRLIICTASAISAPHGVEMALADLARLRQLAHAAPHGVLDWHPSTRTITSRSTPLALAAAPQLRLFDPAAPPTTNPILSCSAADRLIERLAQSRQQTGFGDQWQALTHDPDLTRAVASLTDFRVDQPVLRLLGRGPGLTPSGDDVLVGMLAGLWSFGTITPSRLGSLPQQFLNAAKALTTDISVGYLYHASYGRFIGALCDILTAFDRSQEPAIAKAVLRLRNYGHTSGMDNLLGLLTTLRFCAPTQPHPSPAPNSESATR
jgi:hypothetical protein